MEVVLGQVMHSLIEHLFDYAGLFPPAKLSLPTALGNYTLYQEHEYKNMLGKFILPIQKSNEYLKLIENDKLNKQLSLILTAPKNEHELVQSLSTDCINIIKIVESNSSSLIDAFEIRFFDEFYEYDHKTLHQLFSNIFNSLSQALKNQSSQSFEFFCEMPFLKVEILHHFFNFIQDHNNTKSAQKIFIKLRAGGITPSLVPNSNSLAEMFLLLSQFQFSFKMTAGLHIPVPNYNSNVGATMHGFLNVIFASMFAFYNSNSEGAKTETNELLNTIASIIKNLNYDHIQCENNKITLILSTNPLQKISFPLEVIKKFRKNIFKGIGTCDFIEPIETLDKHIKFLH